jgi:hypothetical protein
VIANRQTSFTFSADQPGASFECSVDGGTFASCPPAAFQCKIDKRPFAPCGSPRRFKLGRGKHRSGEPHD